MARSPYRLEDDTGVSRWLRRLTSVGGYVLLWLVFVVLLLPMLLLALVADLVLRGPLPRTRVVAFLFWVTTCDMVGLGAALVNWILAGPFGLHSEARSMRLNRALQVWWSSTMFKGGRLIFSIDFQLEGDAAGQAGSLIVLSRHCSLGDTVMPIAILPHLDWRYVLKRELLFHPCLDIVGQRLPTAFVRRGGADSGREIARVNQLGQGLGPTEAVNIFPEGTRFTPERREHLLARLEEKGDTTLLAEARGLSRTLPPRPGGVLALLDAAPDADVLILGHTGLEGTSHLGDVWRGKLVRKQVWARVERFARQDIPSTNEERRLWLLERWREVDSWIADKDPS